MAVERPILLALLEDALTALEEANECLAIDEKLICRLRFVLDKEDE